MDDERVPYERLASLCTKIGSGATPRGGNSVYMDSGEFSLIRSQNVLNNAFSKNGLVYIDSEAASKLDNVSVEDQDVLLNITGDSVARCCQVDSDLLPARVNQHVAIIRPIPNKLDPRYLRYFLVSRAMQNHMLGLAAAGATRNALTKGMIENFEIPIPTIGEQKSIAHVLGTLDDKIELNRQMNATLESMAQALFKSWFVDFGPVIDNALEAGNPIPEPLQARTEVRKALGDQRKPLPEHIRRQFPSSFAFSEEMGWIPAGWECLSLKQLGSVSTGKTPPSRVEDAFDTVGLPFITPTDIDDSIFIISTKRSLTENGISSVKKSLVPARAICVTCIGSQMGKTIISPSDAATNQQINSINVNQISHRNWLFLSLRNRREELFLLGSSGSTMPIVNKSTFENLPVLKPSDSVLESFDPFVSVFFDQILASSIENTTLARLRDTLLPKLLSGQLRTPDAEKQLAEAI